MPGSRKNRNEKRTIRKKNKKYVKSGKKKRVKNKRTKKKKRINLQIGGNVEPIMARLLHTLERDVIEYLPSTKVIDTLQSEKHYIEMVDYIKLQEVINNNENFKKSPKIRKLFDYDLYEINNKDMYFVYKDFKCENIFKDVDKYYIYILYFYLMECNITRNDKIQQDGGQLEIKNEPEAPPTPSPEAPPTPSPEAPPAPSPEAPPAATPEAPPAATPEAPPAATPEEPPAAKPEAPPSAPVSPPEADAGPDPKPEEPKEEPETPADQEQPGIEKDQVMGAEPDVSDPVSEPDDPIPEENPDDILDDEMKKLEEEGGEEENEDMEEQIEIANEIELPGFEEYEETRMKLDMKSSVVNGNIKITNSDLIKYKVNWFNVCMGIDIFDTGFENKVSTKMEEIGLKPFKRDKFLEKIELILNDKEMTSNFKNAIYERLMENCKEPEDFINNKKKCESTDLGPIDKFLGLFRKCHEKEMKDNDGILYLYDKYKTILNRNTTIISNVDLILIILNCEIRQRILSYHISVELIRRRNNENKTVKSILENIYEIDKPVIEEVEKELRNKIAEETIERRKIIQEVNKEEIERRKEQMIRKPEPELIRAILEKQNEDPNNTMANEEIKQFVGRSDKKNDDFIDEHRNDLKKQTFNIAAAAAGGGNPESDPFSDVSSPESDPFSDVSSPENDGELNMLQSDMFGDNMEKEKNHMYDIHNRGTQSEFCKSIGDIVRTHHLKSPHLLDKCKTF